MTCWFQQSAADCSRVISGGFSFSTMHKQPFWYFVNFLVDAGRNSQSSWGTAGLRRPSSHSVTKSLTHQNLNSSGLLPGRTVRACAWCTPFECQWVICMIRLGWGQGQCWPGRLPGQLWLTRGEAWSFSKAKGHLARAALPRRSHAWQVEMGKGRVAPKVGRGATHAFTLVLLTRAKNRRGFSSSLRHPEQMPLAALTSGYTCLLRCSASSLERLRIKTQWRQSFVSFCPDRAHSGLDAFQATPFPFLSTRAKDIYLSTD